MAYVNPTTGGTPASQAPVATSGRPQAPSPRGPKLTVKVKAHTRTINPNHAAAVARRDAKLHANAMKRYGAAHAPAPKDPNQSLIDAAVRTRFGPQEQAYGQQLAQNQTFSQGVPAWFTNAQAEIAAIQGQGQKQSQDELKQIQAYNSQPATGTALDQQAATSRNNLNSQYAAMFGRDAQANSDFMDHMRAAYVAQQNNQLAGAAADRAKLLAGQTDLKGQEGDFRTTYGAQLTAAQQKAQNDAENTAIKRGTLAYLTGNEQSQAKDRVAKQKIARSNVRIKKTGQSDTRNQNAVKNALAVGKERRQAIVDEQKLRNPKKTGQLTASQRTAFQNNYDSGVALVRQIYGGKHFDPNTVADQLATSKHKIPRDLALAGAELVKNEKLGIRGIDNPALARRIRNRYGIKVPVAKQSPVIGGVVKHIVQTVTGQ